MAQAQNVIGGAAKGASAGAAFGPYGAAAGGVLGGVLGFMEDDPTAVSRAALREYDQGMGSAMNAYQGAQGKVLGQYDDLWDIGTVKGAKGAYTGAASSADPMQWQVDQGAGAQVYTDAKDMARDYLDPSIAYQQEAARKNVEESAAGQGGLYSGAAAREIAADTAKIAEQGYQQAFQNAASEQNRRNAATTQTQANAMGAGNYNMGLSQTNLGNLEDVYDTEREVMDMWSSGQSDLNRTALTAQQQAANARLQGRLGTAGGNDIWGTVNQVAGTANQLKNLWGT